MKLVMTLVVRDEEDVLDDHLRYHLDQGVDLVIATNNRSVDATGEILARYERMGVVTVIDEPEDTFAQGRWVTRMAQLAYAEHGADWVINSDADEFWWPITGNLTTTLDGIPPAYGAVAARRVNFRPVPAPSAPFYDHMVVRDVRSLNSLGQPLPMKLAHRGAADVVVEQGNHRLSNPTLPDAPVQPIVIFHYPLRSFEQFRNKVVNGGRAYERNPDLPVTTGSTWRWLYEAERKGELREYYESQVVDPADAEPALREGQLVVDRRLCSVLSGYPRQRAGGGAPPR